MVSVLALGLLLLGLGASLRQKRKSAILSEIVDFIRFIRLELQYRATDSETLGLMLQKENFKYIQKTDGGFRLSESVDEKVLGCFNSFINHLGTTDREGQLSLCDEYSDKFNALLDTHKQSEKSKIQVNTKTQNSGRLIFSGSCPASVKAVDMLVNIPLLQVLQVMLSTTTLLQI